MMININVVKIGNAIAQMLMLFMLEFIALGFAKIVMNKQSKVWERVLGTIEILIALTVIFLWCY